MLALLAAGVGLLVLQQRRLSELEAKLAATTGALPTSTVAVASNQGALPPLAASGESAPVPSGNKVIKSGLSMAQALALAQSLQSPPPPLPAASVTLPNFLAQQKISPELWKKVEVVNQKAGEQMHGLGRTLPSGSVEESEARLATIETERKAAISKLLNPEQMQAYEAMRATGDVEGMVLLADGAVKRWVLRY